MRRAGLLLAPILAAACAHAPESGLSVATPEAASAATVQLDQVALELEIYEPHDGTTVARPALIAPVGEVAAVHAEFTLRPARRHIRTLSIEMTPTEATAQTCQLAVRSAVFDDPRNRMVADPESTRVPVGEWVDVVTTTMVAARIRCTPPGGTLADSPALRSEI